ncbi:MAG TPA: winged helix DNA-binding domain-containing protein [Gaiellaceae bacterium]|nr:winged helix DNA-binding domain-containing protein [Gaiellaceae bacterium]
MTLLTPRRGQDPGMVSATWDEVRARRLARSSLAARAPAARLVDVAHDLGGVHAQVQAAAELQLAFRVDGIAQAGVREALWERRLLVKAWTLRGTLHLHPAVELALWRAARRAVAGAPGELAAWRDPAGVLHPEVGRDEGEAIRAAVWDALDGRCLLREELAGEVAGRVGPEHEERLRSGFAFFLSELCQGPPQGAKVTFVRPDQWIEGWQEVGEEEALAEVCRRYLRTYGPARPGDFREWFASPVFKAPEARALFDSLGDELEEIDVEGHRAFVLAGDTAFPPLEPTLRLLPEYDVYIMGFRERGLLIPEVVREQIAAHGRGRYEGPAGVRLLVIDGVAAGLWERKKRGKRIDLQVTPARRLTRPQRAELDDEVERIGAFTGLEPVLAVE